MILGREILSVMINFPFQFFSIHPKFFMIFFIKKIFIILSFFYLHVLEKFIRENLSVMIIFPFYNFLDFDRSTFIVYRGNYYYFQNHLDFTYDIVSNFFIIFIIFLHLIFIKFTMGKFISHDNFSLLKFFVFFGFFLVRWTLYLLQTRVFNDPIFPRFYIFLLFNKNFLHQNYEKFA